MSACTCVCLHVCFVYVKVEKNGSQDLVLPLSHVGFRDQTKVMRCFSLNYLSSPLVPIFKELS